jgi:hypothetical protein
LFHPLDTIRYGPVSIFHMPIPDIDGNCLQQLIFLVDLLIFNQSEIGINKNIFIFQLIQNALGYIMGKTSVRLDAKTRQNAR